MILPCDFLLLDLATPHFYSPPPYAPRQAFSRTSTEDHHPPLATMNGALFNMNTDGLYWLPFTNFIERELTQCRTLAGVLFSPVNTWPKWPPQLTHSISVRIPSGSGRRFTAPGISLSNAGQPQWASNLFSERYSWALHRRQI